MDYVPERGYYLGPSLPMGERPFAMLWEQSKTMDSCAHIWERVIVVRRNSEENEPVVRCLKCHTPRCGDSTDRNPCMERRHHDSLHIYLSGEFAPKGGHLSTEA